MEKELGRANEKLVVSPSGGGGEAEGRRGEQLGDFLVHGPRYATPDNRLAGLDTFDRTATKVDPRNLKQGQVLCD
ncbi:6215_t:CDS:2, partial [Acaulospora colombiana]